jgi:hypothetical protein
LSASKSVLKGCAVHRRKSAASWPNLAASPCREAGGGPTEYHLVIDQDERSRFLHRTY